VYVFLASISVVGFSHRAAHAQGLGYRIAERLDERRLERDQARLQRDMSQGNTAAVNRDLNRIREDQWWLNVDRQGAQGGQAAPAAAPGASLTPHPQYPGYGYYPSDPTQLYVLPQPAPSPPANTTQESSGASTASPPPSVRVSVTILNSAETGGPVNYVVEGAVYTTESGESQRILVSPSSAILYDRGAEFGVQRYTLSSGVYEFRVSEKGWALYKLAPPREPEREAVPALTRGQNAPATASAPRAGESSQNHQRPQR
jgi:hypothetical protein